MYRLSEVLYTSTGLTRLTSGACGAKGRMGASPKLTRRLGSARTVHVSTGAGLGAQKKIPLNHSGRLIITSHIDPKRKVHKTQLAEVSFQRQLYAKELCGERGDEVRLMNYGVPPYQHPG